MGLFGTQEWVTREYDHEIDQISRRSAGGDYYPEGIEPSKDIINRARAQGKPVKVIAMKTLPRWTWYLKVVE